MDGLQYGNAISAAISRSGWFIGRFIDDDAFRQTHDLEVKWGTHKKGESNQGFAADQVARTISILIRGRLRLTFRRLDVYQTFTLQNEGDYVLWLPGLDHNWLAESDDTVVVTIRWPSLPIPQLQQ